MLVLSRKVGERIMIGEGIEVIVNKIRGDKVTLGIVAPKEVPIKRSELDDLPPQEEIQAVV